MCLGIGTLAFHICFRRCHNICREHAFNLLDSRLTPPTFVPTIGPTSSPSPSCRACAESGLAPEAKAAPVKVDASAIEAIFATASAKLKFPKFILTRGPVTLKVAKAGPRSKHHGSITVAAPEFGAGWFGVIKDGAFHPARGATPEVVQLVKDFAADPAKVAAEHGHASGNCCFCRRELTTPESLAAGFGPVCAENFGLPWGDKTAAA